MTTETTEPAVQPVETAQQVQLRNYMAAVSALEHMLSTSPVMPDTVDVRVYSFAPASPSLHLHCESIADVEAIGETFAAVVTSQSRRDGRICMSAVGEFLGVPFTAWTLADPAVAA
ncbi:hypothetical protein ACW4TU_30410 [Streptomyces sp. QTS52]